MKHPVKRHRDMWGEFSDDTYEYRGYLIRRDDSTPTGYFGRWRVWPKLYITDTRQRCLKWIDEQIAKKEMSHAKEIHPS